MDFGIPLGVANLFGTNMFVKVGRDSTRQAKEHTMAQHHPLTIVEIGRAHV